MYVRVCAYLELLNDVVLLPELCAWQQRVSHLYVSLHAFVLAWFHKCWDFHPQENIPPPKKILS